MEWRALMADRLAIVAERYPARIPVSIESLADMFASSVEGGIVLARVLDDNRALVGQVQAYRSHIRLIFDPSVALGAEASAPG